MSWAASGRLTNPTANAIVADTGPLSVGTRRLTIVLAASVTAICELQHRDAANALTLKSQIIVVPGNVLVPLDIPCGLDNALNERFRIELVQGITGLLSCSIFT